MNYTNFYEDRFIVLTCTINWANEIQGFTILHKKQNILQFIFDLPSLRFAGHCVYLFQTRDVFKALVNSFVSTSNIYSFWLYRFWSFSHTNVFPDKNRNQFSLLPSKIILVVTLWMCSSSIMPLLLFVDENCIKKNKIPGNKVNQGGERPAHWKL